MTVAGYTQKRARRRTAGEPGYRVGPVTGTSETVMPSGEQHEISHGDQRAVVVEVGGGLRTYETERGPVLDGYAVDEVCSGGRGQPLIPWPNRLKDGLFEFGGGSHQLPLTEAAAGNAIHGLVRWANWTVTDRDANRVVVEHVLHPQPGWSWPLAVAIEYSLDDWRPDGDHHGDQRRPRALPVRRRPAPVSDAR